MKLVNDKDVIKSLNNFKQKPFDYCIIDNFFPTKISKELSNRFPRYNSKIWHTYKNQIENNGKSSPVVKSEVRSKPPETS